ncbi:MAG: S9 family peptidase [Woeseiaceae bacterium]|jgi:dipeptidyl aminopeptidase/acylaminoacyl peptidase|nr:S9 family peptidase [Woeseiaceae bacterium]
MMIKRSATLFLFLLAANSHASEWNNPEDIPVIEPVTVGLAGERPAEIVRYLLAEGAGPARPSPDGSAIAYWHSITGERQLWLVDSDGGWPKQLTFGTGITFFEWAPDGEHLLVGRDADGNEREGFNLLSRDGTKERQILPLSDAFRSFGMFSPDGKQILYSSTERNGTDYDIYVADIDTGESRMVYQGSFGFFPQAWQPGGNLVIVTETRGEDANDVHLLDMSTGTLSPLFQPEIAAAYSSFAWMPDGSGFYLATNQDREFSGLAFYSLKDRTLEWVEEYAGDVSDVGLSDNGRYLTWLVNEDGYSVMHARDLRIASDLPAPSLPKGVYSLQTTPGSSLVSIRVSGPATPGDVIAWDVADGTAARVVQSSLGGLDPASFIAPESHRYAARDGVELQGFLYVPDASQFDFKPPVVVDVHGGPTGQSRPNFEAVTQYLLNKGIAVFAVNVRGSTGYGKTYARLDNQEKRLDSVRDLVDTVRFLANDERLNGNRIAVMGGSYGGYMVNAVLGAYPGVFDAGISMVGVSDWVRALNDASPGLKASDRIEYGDIREERWQEFYEANSPINNADKISVPILVQHGANDPRDPVTESDRLVQAVRDAGGEVRYMRFPDEGHSLAKRKNRVAFYREVSRFLAEQLMPADSADDVDGS